MKSRERDNVNCTRYPWMLIHLVVWFRAPDSRDLLRFNPLVDELNLSALDKIVHLVDLSISVATGEKGEDLERKICESFGKCRSTLRLWISMRCWYKITWYLARKQKGDILSVLNTMYYKNITNNGNITSRYWYCYFFIDYIAYCTHRRTNLRK